MLSAKKLKRRLVVTLTDRRMFLVSSTASGRIPSRAAAKIEAMK